jgi:glucose dehydrogenase
MPSPRLAILTAAILIAAPLLWPQAAAQVEWPYYGGDPGNANYSPLADINPGNLPRLAVAAQKALGIWREDSTL